MLNNLMTHSTEHLNQGGVIMIILYCVCFYLWFLIFKKYFFFKKQYSAITQSIKKDFIHIISMVNKDLKLIHSLITITPLLGLLGTVSGMIKTFDALNLSETGYSVFFSDGIKQALFTTELGLVISIPAYFFFHRLKRYAQKITKKIENMEFSIKNN